MKNWQGLQGYLLQIKQNQKMDNLHDVAKSQTALVDAWDSQAPEAAADAWSPEIAGQTLVTCYSCDSNVKPHFHP
jgi:hypothetical protein